MPITATETRIDQFQDDKQFDSLYPKRIQQLSAKHWTPLAVAKLAAGFLAQEDGSRILDIGAGIGKFCLIGAKYYPRSHFYGVEQRKKLTELADKVRKRSLIENATFIHANFNRLDLSLFDHFYFYNSFYENLVEEEFHIDESTDYSAELFEVYSRQLHEVLKGRPVGTKLVTYHSFNDVVPEGYRLVDCMHHTFLRCWIKE